MNIPRSQITSGREQIEDKTTIHVADIERMTIATKLKMNKRNAERESESSESTQEPKSYKRSRNPDDASSTSDQMNDSSRPENSRSKRLRDRSLRSGMVNSLESLPEEGSKKPRTESSQWGRHFNSSIQLGPYNPEDTNPFACSKPDGSDSKRDVHATESGKTTRAGGSQVASKSANMRLGCWTKNDRDRKARSSNGERRYQDSSWSGGTAETTAATSATGMRSDIDPKYYADRSVERLQVRYTDRLIRPSRTETQPKDRDKDGGCGGTTIKTTSTTSTDTREDTDSRRYVGVRPETQKSRRNKTIPLQAEINMISVTRERHVYLSEAYQQPSEDIDHGQEDPSTDKEAMDSPDWEKWYDAKELENSALAQKEVMVLVDIKPGMTLIKSKYVFKIKRKFGKIERYKARLVAMGYDQEINAQLNFAPVVKPNTVRLLMALAQIKKMAIHQIDISNAFCCADIEGEVHISAPKGMEIPEGKCFKLLKSLYGLRSSPRSWNKTIDKTLRGLNFMPTVSDPCLYSRWAVGKLHLILVYVDDILIASEDDRYIDQIKKDICDEYDMTDMGELDNFLNAKITRTRDKITISQTHYCREVLKKFDFLVRDKVTKSPLPSDALEQLAQASEMTPSEQSDVDSYPYRQIIGALLYVAMYTNTKPEI